MNKTSLAITVPFLCLIFSPAYAQPELEMAIKGGLNAATLAEDNRVSRYGFSGGLSGDLEWPIIEHFLLGGQADLLYTPRGAKVIFGGEYLGESRQHYLDLMVTARPGVALGPANVYLLLGGGLSLLLTATKESASGAKENISGDLHRIDAALLGGAGIALHLPRCELGPFKCGTIFVEARHDIGLLDTDAVNGGFKNRTSSLMLGLSFGMAGASAPSNQPIK